MTYTKDAIQTFLASLAPFDLLPADRLATLLQECLPLRYRMGQAILVRDALPAQILILYEGQVRLLAYDPRTPKAPPTTLQLLNPGAILGWLGLVRDKACETAIASTEAICLTLPAPQFLELLTLEPSFAAYFQTHTGLAELFELVGQELDRRADGVTNLKNLTLELASQAQALTLPPGTHNLSQLAADRIWWLSSGNAKGVRSGDRLQTTGMLEVAPKATARLIGVILAATPQSTPNLTPALAASDPVNLSSLETIPFAPDEPPALPPTPSASPEKWPYIQGRGPINAPLACFQMLARHWGLPFRRDVIRRVISNQVERSGQVSLQVCGAIAELMGLKAQLVEAPAKVFTRLQAPALIFWQGSLAILYQINEREIVLAIPEQGIVRRKPASFLEDWGESGQVLLLEPTKHTPRKQFSLRWFLPSVYRYRKVLTEVLIASFFVQLFALANPLGVQVIIDKVLVQNSIATLNVLGIFLLILAIFEALLSSFRTYLFVDTTNRIDLALGSEVIDHLLRLPLRYFDRRPVGELSTRVNELENIRQFLTGTALTVVLDAIFSVIYIVVMLFYSWLMTIIALATVPLFALLTFIFAPLIRQQARTKAERNAETQSYLVEVLSGIQTVKAQNIELKSRWKWQERYARYVSAGFEAVVTSTSAGSISNFLNKLSGLLLLWVGAYLVLAGQLSLGQLIAFRIIASYTTSPLLRLIQLWQNFQETALSLERLGDILDTPQELEHSGYDNIPMPLIEGAVRFDDVTFGFPGQTSLQLKNIHLEFPAGNFIGIAGQSGSGKSTLMKLLMRLYEPNSGRILIDNYDVGKVELYSLRRQIGMVLQDSLLFDGTVQENIALTCPDASAEEIIEAAKIAHAHDFIMMLPQGYNTRVGERGSSLSGGQRQRIAIARVILQNPRLLILDEATSALDYDSERRVCQNLIHAFRDRTVFFITHRLPTLRYADRILMMDQGVVVEQGTHDELMGMGGRYYCLYQQQEATDEL